MNRIVVQIFFAIIASISLIVPVQAATETYTIDPTHSYVLWHISHFGFSEQSGKWMAAGTINLDEAKPQDSKVIVKINVADVITGNSKLDENIRTEFFDVDKFPTATFVSNKIQMTGKDSGKIYGTLTLHGVSKPVELNTKLNKVGTNPITNKKTAGFVATTRLKRSDFGINAYLPGLGDDVKLDIQVEAYKNQ